jgi:hypothetical protein
MDNVTEISKPAFAPKTITVDGVIIEQTLLSTKTVKELLNVRQKDDKFTAMENQSWIMSHAFFGDDKHVDVCDEAIPYAYLPEYFTNILEFNRLLKAGPDSGDSPATGETAAS